ncbi:MAG: sigma-70 family RNA polymerase sigma factor [Actinobacteria bacterium]|nr:sigma-70 family RNA polymerase sigma factor [Actinomycetota bacterium]
MNQKVDARGTSLGEGQIIAALRAGDETVFETVVSRYAPSMLRVARSFGLEIDAAEDAVQEAWLRVLRSLEKFEGRSSFRTWLFAILANCARHRANNEREAVPVAGLGEETAEPAVDESRFFPAEHPRWAGMWSTLVDSWEDIPDERLLADEARERVVTAVDGLPERYATVFYLRDVEGWTSEEVCAILDVTPENQRVLLHRARTRVRAALEEYFEGDAK